MANIFTIPAQDLRLDHVRTFLGLDSETDARPKEGLRIDYKCKISKDFPKIVAAFANTRGGIAFLGVDETNGAPVALCGYPRSRTDLQTAIVGAIQSSLNPRYPEYEVIVLKLNESHDVAVVRVPEGDDQPYQHQNGAVYVRSGDMTRAASVDEIVLFASRNALAAPSLENGGIPSTVWVRRTFDRTLEADRSPTFLSLCVRPIRPRAILLDRAAENAIEAMIRECFELPFTVKESRGPLIEWNHHPKSIDIDRHIAVVEDGRVCYVGQVLQNEKTLLLPLIDVGADFCAFALKLLHAWEQHGKIEFAIQLSTKQSEIIGERDVAGREVMGIHRLGEPSPNHRDAAVFHATVDDLERSDDFLSRGFFQQLRSERGASITFEVFAAAVRERVASRRNRG